MTGWSAVVVALVSGGFALAGALGSQWLASRRSRMELSFQARAKAYSEYLAALGGFAVTPRDETIYTEYLSAYERVRILGSDEVVEAIEFRPTGLRYIVQKLRTAEDDTEQFKVKVRELHNAVEAISKTMRRDMGFWSI